jgi:hypothetical protein
MAAQDVVNPSALACFFEDDDVFGLFDDTDSAFIATGIGANWAGIGFGEVVADFALFDFGFDGANGLGEGEGIGGFGFEDMKSEAFGGLRANARKASQLLNKFINGFSIAGRHSSTLRSIPFGRRGNPPTADKAPPYINIIVAISIPSILQKSKSPVKILTR